MKKLFLTSGLVLCMACPAFASNDITTGGKDSTNTSVAANCTNTYLNTYDVSSTLEAKWNANVSGQITLNNGRWTANDAQSAAQTASTNPNPSTIWSVYGLGIYNSAANAAARGDTGKITKLTANPAMVGYNFTGFYTTKFSGGTQVIDSSGNFTPAATTQVTNTGDTPTWYPRWTAKTYNVTYKTCTNGSGSDVTSTNTPVTYDSNYTPQAFGSSSPLNISGITANTGYHFTTWNDGTTDRAAGTAYKYTTDGALTLTAKCAANTTTVTYGCGTKPTGASTTFSSTAPGNGTATFGSSFTFATPGSGQCALPGYTGKWSCTGASGVTGLTATPTFGQEVTWAYQGAHQGSVSCTATWTANKYTVTYKKGAHGTGSDYGDTNAATFDSSYTPKTTTAVSITNQTGYHFTGWKGNKTPTGGTSGSGLNYTAGTAFTYQIQGALELTAQWAADSHTIAYTCGSAPDGASTTVKTGSGYSAPDTSNVSYDGSFSLPTTAGNCALDGYHFIGWSCNKVIASGTSASYSTSTPNYPLAEGVITGGSGTYKVDANTECHAVWGPNSISITWDDNNATSAHSGGSGTCTYDGDLIIPTTPPQRTGYTFDGWKVKTN